MKNRDLKDIYKVWYNVSVLQTNILIVKRVWYVANSLLKVGTTHFLVKVSIDYAVSSTYVFLDILYFVL